VGHFNFLILPKEKDSQNKVAAQLRFCFFPEACWKTLQSNLKTNNKVLQDIVYQIYTPGSFSISSIWQLKSSLLYFCWVKHGFVKNQISNSEFSGRTSDHERHNSQCADISCYLRHKTHRKDTKKLLYVCCCWNVPPCTQHSWSERYRNKRQVCWKVCGISGQVASLFGGNFVSLSSNTRWWFQWCFLKRSPPDKFAMMKPILTNHIKL